MLKSRSMTMRVSKAMGQSQSSGEAAAVLAEAAEIAAKKALATIYNRKHGGRVSYAPCLHHYPN